MAENEAPDAPTTDLGASTRVAAEHRTPATAAAPPASPAVAGWPTLPDLPVPAASPVPGDSSVPRDSSAPAEGSAPAPVAEEAPERPAGSGGLRGMLARRRRELAGGLLATPDRSGGAEPATGPGALPRKPGRISRPVRAGALIGGLVLVAGAFTIAAWPHGPSHHRPGSAAGIPLAGDPNNGFAGAVPSALPTLNPTGGTLPTGAGNHGNGNHGGQRSGHHSQAGSGHPTGTTTTVPPATFAASTGPDCATTAAASYQRVGSYDDGQNGWMHTGSGCGGQSDALPMSGDANSADPTLYALWTFHTGQVSRGRCAVSVYIAGRDDIRYTGGDPAYYYVQGPSGGQLGSFTVDQPGHLGQWVAGGSFPVSGGELVLKVSNQGLDWSGDTRTYRHVAAGPVQVRCTAG